MLLVAEVLLHAHAEFSGGLVSQEDIGVLFRFVHNLGQH